MRCEHCGGEITLESANCPYCGTVNKHAQQHAENMTVYRRGFEKTRKGVQDATHKYAGTTVRLIIIAVLVVLITVLLVVSANAYSWKRMWVSTQNEKNAEQIMEQMDAYLEQEDYLAFSAFCEERYIYAYDTVFEQYIAVERAAQYYCYVYQSIMEVACPPIYLEQETAIERLAENLDYFYEYLDLNDYEYYEIDLEQSEQILADMEDNISKLLQEYCGLTEQETAAMKTLSTARRAITLEEAILNED